MRDSPEKQVKLYCEQIRKEISCWKYINQNGCNDPFWPDGCNMNLTRNHIIYTQKQIQKICEENQIPLPEEYYLSIPPEVDNQYMANRKQKDRVKRLKMHGKLTSGKYEYDEQQICMF